MNFTRDERLRLALSNDSKMSVGVELPNGREIGVATYDPDSQSPVLSDSANGLIYSASVYTDAAQFPSLVTFFKKSSGQKIPYGGRYDLFRSSDGWQRMCDGASDTQKVSLLDVLIPAGTLRDGAVLKFTHYWQFPTGDKTTTGTGTKNLILSLDDSVNSTSVFYATTVNSGRAFHGVTEMMVIGDTLFVPNQLQAAGQSTNAPVVLAGKDFQRDHTLRFYSYWNSNQTANTDSICLSHCRVEVHS